MTHDLYAREVQTRLAQLTDTHADDWFLVTKARHGMEVVFRTLATVHGRGEIITQPFTCITAVNPILSSGNTPVYVDTSPLTLSLDVDKLTVNVDTRTIIIQHTFGIPGDLKAAWAATRDHPALIIEDSAHCLGYMAKDGTTPLADVSIHSFGVEKLLPTKFGGAVWLNPTMKDNTLREALIHAFTTLPTIAIPTSLTMHKYRLENRVLRKLPEPLGAPLLAWLSKYGMFHAPIMPIELHGKDYGVPAQPPTWELKRMLAGLAKHTDQLNKRRIATNYYLAAIRGVEGVHVAGNIAQDSSLVRFPLLLETAEAADTLFNRLNAAGYYAGKWYRPTLFPGPVDPAPYRYQPALCPVAEDLSARIVNLPTNVTLDTAKEIVNVISR